MNRTSLVDCLSEQDRIHYIKIENIEKSQKELRKAYDKDKIKALADSISRYGIIQPLSVRKTSGQKPFELICGHRRFLAAQSVGLSEVPCLIVKADDENSTQISVVENLQRQDLTIFEEAFAIANLKDSFNLTQEEIATNLSVSQSYIANKLRILKLSDEEQKLVLENSLSERHCRALLVIKDEKLRLKALKHVISKKMNVLATERYIDTLLNKKSKKKTFSGKITSLSPFYSSISNAIKSINSLGINATSTTTENETETVITIHIPK